MSRKKAIRAHYEPRLALQGPNYHILDWASAASQRARFNVFVDEVALAGRTLLDVGCGLGDLWEYLNGRGVDVDYTGVDLLEKMVRVARRLHPEGRFVCGDVFGAHSPFAPDSFDVTFCSGIFNLNLGNNQDFLRHAVGRLLELTRETAVFNLLHARARQRDGVYAYYYPDLAREIAAANGWRCRIVEDYLPNDFTAICTPHEA